jgi:hypothetical protein
MLGDDAGDFDGLTFWDLFRECVEVCYASEPEERLGTVRRAMIARFGTINSPTWERVENTALRLVCWMEEFGDR